MADIRTLTVDGTTYDIKDATARADIVTLQNNTADLPQIRENVENNTDDIANLKSAIDSAFDMSNNLYNPSTNSVGTLLASNGILYPSYPDYTTSDYIPVNQGDTVRAQVTKNGIRYDSATVSSGWSFVVVCYYREDGSYISGENNRNVCVVPENAKFLRFTTKNSNTANLTDISIIISTSGTILPYVAYGDIWYLKEKYIPDSYDEHIKEVAGETSNSIILNIPSKIYAVVGIELNIYFENITEDWTKYQWDVTCTKGKQMQRGYTITPSAGDVGQYTLTIRASIDQETYKDVSTTLIVASSSAASGISIIVLGDSTTDNGMAVAKIHVDFESASTTVQTLGTRGTAPNKHEGRSGWRAYDYLTVQSRDGVNNPFYNPTSGTFDATYYFSNSGVSIPDWFFINLGINDVFGYANDTNLNAWIPLILGYYDTIVESLQSAEPDIKIGICITIPPNDSQDAFGKAYACSQTRDRAKRNNVIWAEKLIEHFADKENEGIYLVPIHVNLDTIYNMGMETLPVNARNTSVTYQSPIGNGGVHPVESGYWQIADVYTAFLKAYAN